MVRPPCCDKEGVKKGPWTPEEDLVLVSYIQEHGPGNWRAVPAKTDHEIVEYVAAEEPEYEEIMEVYEEEVPVQEGAPEPSTTNFAAHQDAQGVLEGVTLVEFEGTCQEVEEPAQAQEVQPAELEANEEVVLECPQHEPSSFVKDDIFYNGCYKYCLLPARDDD